MTSQSAVVQAKVHRSAGIGRRLATHRSPTDMLTRILVSLLRLLFGCCVVLSSARAADPEFTPQVWLNPGIFSHHFDRSKDFREDNVGLGAEVLLAPDHALMAGTFINSQRSRTHYGAYEWRPMHWQPYDIKVSAGVIVGAFDGYPRYHNGGWFLAGMPVLAIEGKRVGINLSIIPTIKDRVDGAIAVQIKLRVW